MAWVLAIGVLVLGAVFLRKDSTPTSAGDDNPAPTPGKVGVGLTYSVDPQRPYGPRWGMRRPPGLPESARKAGVTNSAEPFVLRAADELGASRAFAAAVIALLRNESGARMGLPANSFDARPESQRGGGALITAWGAFQYNRGAWHRESGVQQEPWDAGPVDEVKVPMRKYLDVWTRAKDAGAPDAYAERAIRLWHVAPVHVNAYIARGAEGNWPVAWARVNYTTRSGRDARALIDSKLGVA